MAGSLLLILALLLGADEDTAQKKLVNRSFKVTAVDSKARRFEVKEAGYEVLWHETKTRFYHHRSIALKDLPDAATLHVFGKRHEPRSLGTGYGESDPLLSDVAFIGVGAGFQKPFLEAKVAGADWSEGTLVKSGGAFFLKMEQALYRIAGDPKLAAYSLASTAPEKLKGLTVQVRGNARKVTIERSGKPAEVTRVSVMEIHLLELSPEHRKTFQVQWVERKQGDEPVGQASKGKK